MIKKFYVSKKTEGYDAPEMDKFQQIEKLNLLLSSGWIIKGFQQNENESWFVLEKEG